MVEASECEYDMSAIGFVLFWGKVSPSVGYDSGTAVRFVS